jgi:hypothetical protein
MTVLRTQRGDNRYRTLLHTFVAKGQICNRCNSISSCCERMKGEGRKRRKVKLKKLSST